MPRIFISYRQDDAKAWAVLLRTELCRSFGEREIFLDKDTLGAGAWHAQIQESLQQARVVLVVIGRQWVSIVDKSGQRRLDDPADVHRNEIAYALSAPGLTVVPVRVDGSTMPTPEELPPDLKTLCALQSFELSDNAARRESDLRRLTSSLERLTGLRAGGARPQAAMSPGWRLVRSAGLACLAGLAASLCVAVASDVLLGWTFNANEALLLAALFAAAALAVRQIRRRLNQRSEHAGR